MVRDEVWDYITSRWGEDVPFLCVGCLEARLGRSLCRDDFRFCYRGGFRLRHAANWLIARGGAENG